MSTTTTKNPPLLHNARTRNDEVSFRSDHAARVHRIAARPTGTLKVHNAGGGS